jgi:membrane fusion protein, multidrug efflux system
MWIVRLALQWPNTFVVMAMMIVVGAEGTRVAVVETGRDGPSVRYEPVTLGRDFGADVEILSGLAGSESPIANPGDSLPEGARVQAVATEPVRPVPDSNPKPAPAGRSG